MIKRFKRWNCWRKHSLNSKLYKFLVLIGVISSPTFILTMTDEEFDEYFKEIRGYFK